MARITTTKVPYPLKFYKFQKYLKINFVENIKLWVLKNSTDAQEYLYTPWIINYIGWTVSPPPSIHPPIKKSPIMEIIQNHYPKFPIMVLEALILVWMRLVDPISHKWYGTRCEPVLFHLFLFAFDKYHDATPECYN